MLLGRFITPVPPGCFLSERGFRIGTAGVSGRAGGRSFQISDFCVELPGSWLPRGDCSVCCRRGRQRGGQAGRDLSRCSLSGLAALRTTLSTSPSPLPDASWLLCSALPWSPPTAPPANTLVLAPRQLANSPAQRSPRGGSQPVARSPRFLTHTQSVCPSYLLSLLPYSNFQSH